MKSLSAIAIGHFLTASTMPSYRCRSFTNYLNLSLKHKTKNSSFGYETSHCGQFSKHIFFY